MKSWTWVWYKGFPVRIWSHSAFTFPSPPPSLPPSLPPTHSLFVVFPARAPSNMTLLTAEQMELGIEAGEDRHAGTQAGYQLALLGSTLLVSIFGGLFTGTSFMPFMQLISRNSYEGDSYVRGSFIVLVLAIFAGLVLFTRLIYTCHICRADSTLAMFSSKRLRIFLWWCSILECKWLAPWSSCVS